MESIEHVCRSAPSLRIRKILYDICCQDTLRNQLTFYQCLAL
jgi:hypothetical protein